MAVAVMGIALVISVDWLKTSIGIKCNDPVKVISLPTILEDLKMQGTKYGSVLAYYVKPFPENDKLQYAETLIIGDTIIGDILKKGFVLEQSNPLRDELFVMDEILALKERIKFC